MNSLYEKTIRQLSKCTSHKRDRLTLAFRMHPLPSGALSRDPLDRIERLVLPGQTLESRSQIASQELTPKGPVSLTALPYFSVKC